MRLLVLSVIAILTAACGAPTAKNVATRGRTATQCAAVSPQNSATQVSLAGAWASSARDVYVVGDSSVALHSSGTGAWVPLAVGQPGSLSAVWGSSARDVYAVGFGGAIVHSSDGGATWATQASSIPINPRTSPVVLTAVWGSSASDVYAVGTQGSIVHSAGDGNWSVQSGPTHHDLFAVWGSSASDVYAAGDFGEIWHSSGDGAWSTVESGRDVIWRGLWGSSAADVYAVGSGSNMLHSSNGGRTWDLRNGDAINNDLFGVWGGGAGDVWVVGDSGTILHAADAAGNFINATFTSLSAGTFAPLSAVFGSSAGDVYLVGGGGTLLHSAGCSSQPTITFQSSRVAQRDIDNRLFTVSQLNDIGDFLFNHVFTQEEGMGNNLAGFPAVASDPLHTPLAGPNSAPNLRRVHHGKFGGPDGAGGDDGTTVGFCQGCHDNGRGDDGGGDLNHTLFQDGDGVSPAAALMRNGRSILGDGYIQQLGIEMTAELKQQAQAASTQAKQTQTAQTVSLSSKGVAFGSLVAKPDGTFDSSGLVGVDADLTIKPFGWKGRLAALRRFVEGGFQVHFGMQTEVLTTKNCATPNPLVVGNGPSCSDPDNDGVTNEITEGQLTTMSIYAAVRQAPIRIAPSDPTALARAQNGEQLFARIGCASCHTPRMTLNQPIHQEAPDLTGGVPLPIDLTADVEDPKLPVNSDGTVTVELFSDLKRHDMGASLADPHPTFGVIAASLFITPPLWGIEATAPYLHDGRAPTLHDAIAEHDGEANSARLSFLRLSSDDQAQLIEFLQTLTRDPNHAH